MQPVDVKYFEILLFENDKLLVTFFYDYCFQLKQKPLTSCVISFGV